MMSTEHESRAQVPPSMQVMQLLWPAAMALQAIHVAAELSLADLLASGPKTAAELAPAAKVHTLSLDRLLRALTSLGIFAEDNEGRYCQSALSDVLRSDHPGSIRPWARMLGAGFVWAPTGALDATIRTGQPAFEHVFGAPFFKYLAAHQDDAAVFDAAMSSMPTWLVEVVEAYDFSTFERVVDVGGGRGALLVAILSANPHVHGVLQDLPGVVAGAPPATRKNVADRLEIVAGDFFESVPAGADAYVLSGVIHDWNDEAALRILKNCRRAIRPDGRLLILDTLLTPTSNPAPALMDVLMMVLTGGRERSEPDFRSLLRNAGFSLERVTPTAGRAILESRPV
jgi:SAM-dependent methyltransferase